MELKLENLSKLSKAKYLEGAELAKANAERHIQVAGLCNNNNDPGIGISHLVLGIEEFSKSAVLYIRALDNNLPVVELSKYFFNHEKKHKSIDKFVSGLILTYLLKVSYKELKASLNWGNIFMFGTLFYVINNLINKITTVDKQVLSLEQLRNFGFYVDLSEDDKWRSPQNQFSSLAFTSLHLQVSLLMNLFYSYLAEVERNEKSRDTFIDILINAELLDPHQWSIILKSRTN